MDAKNVGQVLTGSCDKRPCATVRIWGCEGYRWRRWREWFKDCEIQERWKLAKLGKSEEELGSPEEEALAGKDAVGIEEGARCAHVDREFNLGLGVYGAVFCICIGRAVGVAIDYIDMIC